MTLCAGLWSGDHHGHVILSDTLTTSIDSDHSVLIPSRRDPLKWLGNSAASGLRQKVTVINDWMALAFTGRIADGCLLIDRLRQEESAFNRSTEAAMDFILKQRDLHGINNDVLLTTCEEKAYGFKTLRTKSFKMAPFSRVAVIGSGRADFINTVLDYYKKDEFGQAYEAFVDAASMAKWFLEMQLRRGFGLKDGWGGGFELTIRHTDRFMKVDHILSRSFIIRMTDGECNLGVVDPVFYQYYDKQRLIIVVFWQDRTDAFVVHPLGFLEPYSIELPVGKMPVNLIVDFFETEIFEKNILLDSGIDTVVKLNPSAIFENGPDDALDAYVEFTNGGTKYSVRSDMTVKDIEVIVERRKKRLR